MEETDLPLQFRDCEKEGEEAATGRETPAGIKNTLALVARSDLHLSPPLPSGCRLEGFRYRFLFAELN